MKLVVLLVQGYTQSIDKPNGITELHKKLMPYNSPGVLISTPIPWWSDPKEKARYFESLGKPRLVIIAYSWGAGYFFNRFQKKYDGVIHHAVLCDPVKRWGFIPPRFTVWGISPLSAFSMTPFPEMEITSNVKKVSRFFQRINRPQSHRLDFDSDKTALVLDEQLDVKHEDCEDHERFHVHSINVVKDLADSHEPEYPPYSKGL